MDTSAEQQQWFLRKHEDGHTFGPLPFEQLARWASSAQVAPQDVVSTDEVTWMKAPMLEELAMDWLVELTTERYYGPTTLGAIQEFMRLGEINERMFVINSCDGFRKQISEMPLVLPTPSVAEESDLPSGAEEMADEEVLHPPLAVSASHAMAPSGNHQQFEILAGFDQSIDQSERRFRWNVCVHLADD